MTQIMTTERHIWLFLLSLSTIILKKRLLMDGLLQQSLLEKFSICDTTANIYFVTSSYLNHIINCSNNSYLDALIY